MTDRRTDARGKTICLPTLSGGDIMNVKILENNVKKKQTNKPCRIVEAKDMTNICVKNDHASIRKNNTRVIQ